MIQNYSIFHTNENHLWLLLKITTKLDLLEKAGIASHSKQSKPSRRLVYAKEACQIIGNSLSTSPTFMRYEDEIYAWIEGGRKHSAARTMLNNSDPVDISVWKSDGSILELRNCISLRYIFYGGRLAQRQVAFLRVVPQDSRLLYIHGERLHRFFVAKSLRLFR